MRVFLSYLELILTVVGLIVVFVAMVVAGRMGVGVWEAAAVAAVLVGIVHGLLFWVVRRRQRQVRAAAIRDIRAMLSDIINNQLTVIEASHSVKAADEARMLQKMSRSVDVISTSLRELSEESLQSWKMRYTGRMDELVSESTR